MAWSSQPKALNYSILFGVGYLVLEYQKAGTGVSHVWYWSIIMLVLEYHFVGTAHEANDVVDGIYYKRMIIAI